jgi:hypothetical protein
MAAQYHCGNERRRAAVRDAVPPTVNGIDHLEVRPGQTVLDVTFLHPLPVGPAALTAGNVAVVGGTRVRDVRILGVVTAGRVLTVTVDRPGDYSTYTLRLGRPDADGPPPGFDPQLSDVRFSFKADCPSPFDCYVEPACPPEAMPEPEIDYLAKDYASFRLLMLDRLTALLPDWTERNPADAQVALVELLAYVADHLSYYQDAVATEAYLGTARKRVSVRRHARLLDYRVDEGSNSRAWVVLEVTPGGPSDGATVAPGTAFLSAGSDPGPVVHPDDLALALAQPSVFFEAVHAATLRSAHNRIRFHTWSDTECCLPAGATRATLRNAPPLALAEGDVVVLEEVRSPATGAEADADAGHRHAVRLTTVVPGVDPLDGAPVMEVVWSVTDALPFPLCVSALVAEPDGTLVLADVAVARGNVVLVDHGRTITGEALRPARVPTGEPYRPRLTSGPLTFRRPFDLAAPAAVAVGGGDHRLPRPDITLSGEGSTWHPRFDLLASDRFRAEFAVEMEADGTAHLRFGDDDRGRQPQEGSSFEATYRVGNGRAGNVGAEAITRIVSSVTGIDRVRNPLPATGGTDPESIEEVRVRAPEAFRTQERSVTETDYARIGERHPGVQKAAAVLRWTGSWYTAFVTADRAGGLPVDAPFDRDLSRFLDRYRMAGHDVEVDGPVPVALDLALDVCLKPGYFRSHVARSLLEELGSGRLPGSRRGFFHPDNFTFGQPVWLSQVYEAALAVAGVEWVVATRFSRWGRVEAGELEHEVLTTGPIEVARLDNDPNFPENGRLELVLRGGL